MLVGNFTFECSDNVTLLLNLNRENNDRYTKFEKPFLDREDGMVVQ